MDSVPRVLAAIEAGIESKVAIAAATHLEGTELENAFDELVNAGAIRRKHRGGFVLCDPRCLLDDCWPAPIWARFDQEIKFRAARIKLIKFSQ